MADTTAEVTDLLQHLIRNQCVNDGSPESGHESRSADLLAGYFDDVAVDQERFCSVEGRDSLVVRIEGSDPEAPSLLLLGHTDVVPVNPDGWSRDPFSGDLEDGVVWGRGAVDMLNLTASMAVATKNLARDGFKPRGDLIYIAVADEESMGVHGAGHLLDHEREHVMADMVITESGGIPMTGADGKTKLPLITGEKGVYWVQLTVGGTPGHGSRPYKTDNAVVTAAEVVTRLANHETRTDIGATWQRFIDTLFPPEIAEPMTDPTQVRAMCDQLPLSLARQAHACTHMTMAPTMTAGGVKRNVIPDTCTIEVDIRTLPGQTATDVRAEIQAALGDLADRVTVELIHEVPSTESPASGPLWDAAAKVARGFYPDADLVPYLTVGGTDARFYRDHDSVAYGFGLFSRQMSFEEFGKMFHGNDERVDVESLRLSTEMFEALAREVVG